ncbi:MAG: hypothetical protein OEX17_02285, partial [Rhodospirillaceae bacterium]|nr:hypothetical protein [Rhodospirillaceae bacterium]
MQNKSFFSSNHILITVAALVVSFVVFALVHRMEAREVEDNFYNATNTYNSLLEGRISDVKISLDTVAHSVEVE